MKGYKLFRSTRNGLRSLFIDRTRHLPEGVWLRYRPRPTKGYAYRPGWHIMAEPAAPHLSKRGRVMRLVEFKGRVTTHQRPAAQGGLWYTAEFIRIVPEADNA